MARLFLSYRRVDEPVAHAVEAALAAEGHDVFMDCLPDAGIAPGENWEARLYDELHRTDAVVAVVSTAYLDSHWCFAELAIARSRGVTVFPLLLEKNVQHPLLTAIHYVDASGGLDPALPRLAARLRALDAPGGRAWNPDRPIYRGLEAFDADDAAVFFGRTREIADLVRLLSTPAARSERHPLLVVGPSGSGKSSVVRAGLMPALARRDEWLVLPAFFPGDAPFAALAFQIAKTFRQANAAADLATVRQRVHDDPDTLVADLALACRPSASRVLIVVDQFEELTTRTPVSDAQAFLAWIEKAVSATALVVSVVGTLRSDSVSRIQKLWGRPSQSVVPYLLAPLGTAELVEVVKGPARVAGIHVPDPLVATLIAETTDGLALPFLSFVLRELAAEKRRGDTLSADRYRELGGVKHALAQQADAALEETVAATGTASDAVVQLLLGLVTVDDAGRPVRRRRSMSSFSEDQRRVLDLFVSRRLLTSRVDGDAVVEVAHEAFFQSWPPLAEAIRGQRVELELRRDLGRDAGAWARAERATRYLWSGERTRGVARDADLSPDEQAFLQASIDAARQADQARADAVASQILLADLPKIQPETALALATAVAHEIALTPRVARCLHDALVWHEAEEALRAFDIPGLQTAHLTDALNLLTVSTGVAFRPPEPATTRVSPLRRQESAPPAPVKLAVEKWDLDRPDAVWRIDIEGTVVQSVFSASDRVLVCTDAGGTWVALSDGRVLRRDPDLSQGVLAVSRDGTRVAKVRHGLGQTVPPTLEVTDTARGAHVKSFDVKEEIRDARFSNDPGRIAWRTSKGVFEGDLGGETVMVQRVRHVSSEQSGAVGAVWPQPKVVRGSLPREQRDWSHAVVGERAVLWNHDQLVVWKLRSPGSILTIASVEEGTAGQSDAAVPQSPPRLMAIAVGPPRRQLLAAPLRIVTAGGKIVAIPGGEHRSFRAAAFSANARWLVACGRTFIEVYDADSGGLAARFGEHDDEEGDTYCSVAISDDGAVVATGSLGGRRSFVWDTGTGKQAGVVSGVKVAIDPGGRFVLAGRQSSAWVTVVGSAAEATSAPSGVLPVSSPPKPAADRQGHTQQTAAWNPGSFASQLTDLAVSADGTLGAIGSSRWTIVCALPSGEPLFALDVAADSVLFAGAALYVLPAEGPGQIVNIPSPEELLRLADARVRDQPTVEERAAFGLSLIPLRALI
ncbi:MAG: TIR domain-containing protein [Acidobacteriota bacterium]